MSSSPIDPVNAFYEGVSGAFSAVIFGFVLFAAAFATNWTAYMPLPVIPPHGFPNLPGGLVGFLQILWVCCVVGWILTVRLMALGTLFPRIGLFALYTLSCGIWAPFGMNGNYWWIPVLIFLTVVGYYWFGFGLMMKQIYRNQELSQDY